MALKGGVCYVASHSIAGFISVWSRDTQADVSYHTPSTQLALLTAWNGMEWNGMEFMYNHNPSHMLSDSSVPP
jgi:hypothetical protein